MVAPSVPSVKSTRGYLLDFSKARFGAEGGWQIAFQSAWMLASAALTHPLSFVNFESLQGTSLVSYTTWKRSFHS
jgi:hypothetical protein